MEERPLQSFAGTLQNQVFLRGRENDLRGWSHFGFPNFNMVYTRDTCVHTLETIQANKAQSFVFVIWTHCDCGGVPLGYQFDQLALTDAKLLHGLGREPGDPSTRFCGLILATCKLIA
jgi:hypothetical protein